MQVLQLVHGNIRGPDIQISKDKLITRALESSKISICSPLWSNVPSVYRTWSNFFLQEVKAPEDNTAADTNETEDECD